MRALAASFLLVVSACAASSGPRIVPQPKQRMARAGILGGGSTLPPERDGVRLEDTGAIMFICSGSDLHPDKEVLIHDCPACGEKNHLYFDYSLNGFACYACAKPYPSAKLVCPDCGRDPAGRVMSRPQGK